MRIVSSTSATARLAASSAFVDTLPASTEFLVVAATRGAADDFVRGIARRRALFGVHRFSLAGLAARAASVAASTAGRVAGTMANSEAMAARAAFDAIAADELAYFEPVARMPGFPRALARTVHELRLAGVDPGALGEENAAGDLARLMSRIDRQLRSSGVDDRAAMFMTAAGAWRAGLRWFGLPVLLLDVPLNSTAERDFARALIGGASDGLIAFPAGDDATRAACTGMTSPIEDLPDDAAATTDLGRLRRHIFELDPPETAKAEGDVSLFSAPGEAREALEIARRVLDEAAKGVAFDAMAVSLRSPQQYVGLLEHAFARARVPAYFDRGTRRPDPAGRAFVALLACACERLSARRFDEYLSLGQVPRLDAVSAEPVVVIPDDEAYARFARDAEPAIDDAEAAAVQPPPDSDDEAIVSGTLRAPWKWEELIVESAVIGGVDRKESQQRWRRRLDGMAEAFRLQAAELARTEPESPRIDRIRRDLVNLRHLRAFALPIIDTLADWPAQATWGEWLDRLDALAPRVLTRPARVLETLAALRPMASIGPVPLDEVQDVLRDRLLVLEADPPGDRYGRVFVGTPHQLRGRAFRVVFVPGLAERVFPQRVREDPLLPDEAREKASAALVTRADRTVAERLLLRLAIGAATERLYLSYPRLGTEMGDMRPRVPSFYALDVMRAITGRVPDHRALAADAAATGGASLAWPAPLDPARAVDDFEHDLAVLKPLLESQDAAAVKGHAHYLLTLNESLRQSLLARYWRGRSKYTPADGLVRVTPRTAPVLESQRLHRRPYSLSALQRYATCPYQFLLGAIHRIQTWEEPQPVVRMDPLTRGSLFHEAQATFLRERQAAGALPVTPDGVDEAMDSLRSVVSRVADEYAERLAPAIDRVWREDIADIRRDLEIWVRRLSDEREWVPEYFEFSFGLKDVGRDPRSQSNPVTLDARYVLRGSVDLIERRRDGGALRVTDHKTGRNRSKPDMVIGGGSVLQPVLYSLAVEQALGAPVAEARLSFCTTAGGFHVQPFDLGPAARAQGLEALAIVDRAIELGHLPVAPAKDACRWCDFRPVCGPGQEKRIAHKSQSLVADLVELRSRR